MRRTSDDRERAVKAALRHSPSRPDIDIARHVGVSPSTVGKYRQVLEASGEISRDAHLSKLERCAKGSRGDKAAHLSNLERCAADEEEDTPDRPARIVSRKGKTYQMTVGKIGKASKPKKKFGGIAKDAAVPIRKPGQMIPTLTISIPLNNPQAAAGALLSNCEPVYLRAMVARITEVLDERGL